MNRRTTFITALAVAMLSGSAIAPAGWVTEKSHNASGSKTASAPWTVVNGFGVTWGTGTYSSTTSITTNTSGTGHGPGSADVTAQGSGNIGWGINSVSRSGTSSASGNFSNSTVVRWEPPGTPTNRQFCWSGTGSGSVSLSATCSAHSSATATASGSTTGSASGSPKQVNGYYTYNPTNRWSRSISVSTQYNSSTSNFEGKGNLDINASKNDTSVSGTASGSYRVSSNWKVTGTGAQSSSASYSMDDSGCCTGNAGQSKSASGRASVTGAQSVTSNGGSSAYTAEAGSSASV